MKIWVQTLSYKRVTKSTNWYKNKVTYPNEITAHTSWLSRSPSKCWYMRKTKRLYHANFSNTTTKTFVYTYSATKCKSTCQAANIPYNYPKLRLRENITDFITIDYLPYSYEQFYNFAHSFKDLNILPP